MRSFFCSNKKKLFRISGEINCFQPGRVFLGFTTGRGGVEAPYNSPGAVGVLASSEQGQPDSWLNIKSGGLSPSAVGLFVGYFYLVKHKEIVWVGVLAPYNSPSAVGVLASSNRTRPTKFPKI